MIAQVDLDNQALRTVLVALVFPFRHLIRVHLADPCDLELRYYQACQYHQALLVFLYDLALLVILAHLGPKEIRIYQEDLEHLLNIHRECEGSLHPPSSL